MIYPDLVLQQSPWERLLAAHRAQRLAHAHLFYGPAGSGKEGHAIELAAALNCHNLGQDGACGKCPSCRKMVTLQHPDLQIIVPLPRRNAIKKDDPPLKALKPADIEDLTNQLAAKGADPYQKIALDGAQSILINSIRELRRLVALKPVEGGTRIILIFDADKLAGNNVAAANALLKLLEEPPPATVLVLVTDRHNLLPETIHSRCVKAYFPALPTAEAAGYLVKKYGLKPDGAEVVVKAAAGNLHLARQVVASGHTDEPLEVVDDLLAALMQPKPTGWQQVISDMAVLYRRQPAELRFRLQLLQLWLRDLMVLANTGQTKYLVFPQKLADIQVQLENFPRAGWGTAAMAIESAQRLLERNINPTLVITNLILDIRLAMRGRETAPAGGLAPFASLA